MAKQTIKHVKETVIRRKYRKSQRKKQNVRPY